MAQDGKTNEPKAANNDSSDAMKSLLLLTEVCEGEEKKQNTNAAGETIAAAPSGGTSEATATALAATGNNGTPATMPALVPPNQSGTASQSGQMMLRPFYQHPPPQQQQQHQAGGPPHPYMNQMGNSPQGMSSQFPSHGYPPHGHPYGAMPPYQPYPGMMQGYPPMNHPNQGQPSPPKNAAGTNDGKNSSVAANQETKVTEASNSNEQKDGAQEQPVANTKEEAKEQPSSNDATSQKQTDATAPSTTDAVKKEDTDTSPTQGANPMMQQQHPYGMYPPMYQYPPPYGWNPYGNYSSKFMQPPPNNRYPVQSTGEVQPGSLPPGTNPDGTSFKKKDTKAPAERSEESYISRDYQYYASLPNGLPPGYVPGEVISKRRQFAHLGRLSDANPGDLDIHASLDTSKINVDLDDEEQLKKLVGGSKLVQSSDRNYVPDYIFLTMAQLKPCLVTKHDRIGTYKNHEIGFKGLCCKHCDGEPGFGRYFPSTIRSFSQTTTTQTMFKHVAFKCRKCPKEIKEAIRATKQVQDSKDQVAKQYHRSRFEERPKYGSRKTFYELMWCRLHGLDDPYGIVEKSVGKVKKRKRKEDSGANDSGKKAKDAKGSNVAV